jgi:hypothetical protein
MDEARLDSFQYWHTTIDVLPLVTGDVATTLNQPLLDSRVLPQIDPETSDHISQY